jgi:DNA polymerase I-like protein with 3'-5' exonuclease and polymerase domains/uracil-DNA glycosylase
MSELKFSGLEANSYDPRRQGALCEKCFLYQCRVGGPVPTEFHKGSTVALVGEAPGKEEVEELVPFIGASGREMMVALHSLGIGREACTITNSMLCRLPPARSGDSAMEVMRGRMTAVNKEREARGLEPYLHPVIACRPRLHNELTGISNIITLGKWGLRGVTGLTNSILDMRGAPVTGILEPDGHWNEQRTLDPMPGETGRFIRLMPTVHPAFVMRARRWTKVFRTDIARAFQWFRGQLGYTPPTYLPQPTLAEARDFLYSGAPFFAYDLETDAKEPLVAKIRCIGIGTKTACILIPFLTCEYEPMPGAPGKIQLKDKKFYANDAEEGAMVDLLKTWMTDRRILKTGWNIGSYDKTVIEQQWHVTPTPIVDGIVLHRSVDSELPHNLAFVAPLFTPVARAWKASHAATTANTDEELWDYCAVGDTVNTARLMEPLHDAIKMRGQEHLAPIDHKLQAICQGLHKNGLFVNQVTRRRLDAEFTQQALAARNELRLITGDRDFNPNATASVAKILFERFALPPQKITETGRPSTDAETLKLLSLMKLAPAQRDFLGAQRRFRRATKCKGTFIRPLRPYNELAYEDELAVDTNTAEGAALQDEVAEAVEDVLAEMSPKQLKRLLQVVPGLVLADGRVHPSWNSHVPVTGRFSSSEINAQNIIDVIRCMYEAEEGRVYAYADSDQLELRISAALAGDEFYLDAFYRARTDPTVDVHALTALDLYGDLFKHGSAEVRKKIRDFAKRFIYAITYGAKVPTIHRTLSMVEDKHGNLLFPWFAMKDAAVCCERWIRKHPAYPRWWDSTIADFRRDGFLAEPVEGRKRYFMDGEDENEEKNFRVQAAGASAINRATIALTDSVLPFEKWGPGTGLVQQGHDALLVESPESEAKKVAGWLKESMTMRLPGVPHEVWLTAKPKIGKTWADLA